jgi:hypothetical protein
MWICSPDWANAMSVPPSRSLFTTIGGLDTVYHDRFWLYGGINRPGDTYQDIRHLIEMFWIVSLIHIGYQLNMITIQIQCKYNILCSKLYCNHTWTALTLSTSEKILHDMWLSAESFGRKNLGDSACRIFLLAANVHLDIM